MKTITLLAVVAMLLLAVAIYEAWSNGRGAIGWIVNVLACAFGALIAIALVGMAMDLVLPYLRLEGSLASSQNPLKYVVVAAIALVMVLGSWIPLQVLNRLR